MPDMAQAEGSLKNKPIRLPHFPRKRLAGPGVRFYIFAEPRSVVERVVKIPAQERLGHPVVPGRAEAYSETFPSLETSRRR